MANLGKKMAMSDSQLVHMLEEVKLNLESEAASRSAGDEQLEKRIWELRTNFDAHATTNMSSMHELDQRVRSTVESLDAEVRTRTEEASKHAAANAHLKELF